MSSWEVQEADCVEAMREMDEASVDAIVCDPPYGLEFMGKKWDRLGDVGQTSHAGPSERDGSTVFGRQRVAFSGSSNRRCAECHRWEWDYPERKCVCDAPDFPNIKAHQARIMQEWHQVWATEALRVLKPGGHLLAFGGTRTYHRLACAVGDAGFEIRDSLIWLYGSGFPKSLDVSKAIDKAAGAEREVVGHNPKWNNGSRAMNPGGGEREAKPAYTAPATPEAEKWNGWGTALKPGHEPVVMARKPLIGTVAANVLEYGTGGLNIDGTRIEGAPRTTHANGNHQGTAPHPMDWGEHNGYSDPGAGGRWPANVLLDEAAAAELDRQSGESRSPDTPITQGGHHRHDVGLTGDSRDGFGIGYGDTGGASRFFKTVAPDMLCVLCGLPYAIGAGNPSPQNGVPNATAPSPVPAQESLGREVSEARSKAPVQPAGPSSRTTPVTTASTAPSDASQPDSSRSDHDVRSADNLCSECTTAIAQSVARWQQGQTPDSAVGKASINGHSAQILIHSLALIADSRDSTDTTTITRNLSALLGSALGATGSTTAASGIESDPTRFRYQSKASRGERNAGLDGFKEAKPHDNAGHVHADERAWDIPGSHSTARANHHPTVKPIALMRWLCRLVTPPGGTILDPFTGSGTTGVAAVLEDFDFIGIERDAEYVEIARARIDHHAKQPKQMELIG